MKILERRVYRGPNQYALFPVMRLSVDLGALEAWPSAKLDGFNAALLAALPGLDQHTCSYGEPGGFVRRLTEDDGTWLGHVLEHVAIELEQLAGAKVTFGKTRSSGVDGQYHVIYEYEEERVGEAAGDLAHRPARLAAAGRAARRRPAEPRLRLRGRARGAHQPWRSAGSSGRRPASLVRAAEARDIPWLRLNDYSLVQFGHGRYQKRIQATVTSETRHIAVAIASDKEETNRILGDLGLPVPHQRLARSAEEAVRSARRLGFPVVVKPLDANHGRGVSIDLGTDDEVRVAFDKAREHARTIVVETFLAGYDHRMLVVNGALVAVAKRVPGHVVGDGVHTIAELVDLVNADPRRGIGHEKVLTRLEFDHQAERLMEQKGYTQATVLARRRGPLPAHDRQPVHRRHRDRSHRRRAPRQP